MAKVYDWNHERGKRNRAPVLDLPAACQPEQPRHTKDGDDAFACGDCGAVYFGLVHRGKVLGILCSGCGSLRSIRQILTEGGM